jgi:tetratricopeptide (TPR) repeat protein
MQAMYHLGEAALLAGEGKYEEAIPAALNSYEHFMDLENWLGAAWSLHAVGSYKITLSQNRIGRQILAEALALYQTSGDLTGEVTCLSSLAWVDLNLGEVRHALEALTRARELTQQAGDALGQARISHTLAATWNFLYHTKQTEAYAQEAVDLFQKMGLPASRPFIYLATSAWVGKNSAEKGLGKLHQAYTEAVEQNDFWLRGWAAQLLGRAALQAGDWTEAETRLEEAARLRRDSGERANQVSDLAWLGRLRLARGDVSGALSLTERAVSEMATLKEEAWVFEAWDIYRAHAKVLTAQGNPAEAARFEQLAQEAEAWMAAQAPDEESRVCFWTWVKQMRLL